MSTDTPRTDALDCELHNPRVLEDRYSTMRDFARRLERELAEARKDRARLDWLTNSIGWCVAYGTHGDADPAEHATEENTLSDAWRAAIDAAKGGGQ